MAEQVRFYFDPICPWCYQTSRWAHRVEELKRDRLAAPDLESVRRWQRVRHDEEGSRP